MQSNDAPADASTLIYLAKADALREAHAIAGPVRVPPAVWREAVEAGERKGEGDPARIRAALEEGFLRRVHLSLSLERTADDLSRRYRLGRGECQVLAVAGKGDVVLMDDGRASRVAASLGFVPVSTILLPVLGRRRGALAQAQAVELLRRLAMVTGVRADTLARLEAAILEGR